MRDTDWRPSPCPGCGHTRGAQEHPICRNSACELSPPIPEETRAERFGSVAQAIQPLPEMSLEDFGAALHKGADDLVAENLAALAKWGETVDALHDRVQHLPKDLIEGVLVGSIRYLQKVTKEAGLDE